MGAKSRWESKRRFAIGNRGTPRDCLYVKSAPQLDLYLINHVVDGVEHPIVMDRIEAERLRDHLAEHIAIGKEAEAAGLAERAAPANLWGDLADHLLSEPEVELIERRTGLPRRVVFTVLDGLSRCDFTWKRGDDG